MTSQEAKRAAINARIEQERVAKVEQEAARARARERAIERAREEVPSLNVFTVKMHKEIVDVPGIGKAEAISFIVYEGGKPLRGFSDKAEAMRYANDFMQARKDERDRDLIVESGKAKCRVAISRARKLLSGCLSEIEATPTNERAQLQSEIDELRALCELLS